MNHAYSTATEPGAAPVFTPEGELIAARPAPRRRERPPSLLAYPATYLLIGINLVVFSAMFRFGPVPARCSGTVTTARC